MALHSNTNPVYVAFLFIFYYVFITAGSGLSSESSSGLLAPYDEHYYRGVRAYFRDDWERAAEFLEKSISTRDKLLRTRRKCHDECLTAGDDKISKLEYFTLWDMGTLDWIQVRAECVRFCMGQSFSPAALLPVSSDIEYEFGTRNPYNYLQVTYYKLEKMAKAASAAHTFFVANPSHLEMRNNLEKYRRILGVKEESFQDREREQEQHWVSSTEGNLQSAHKLKKWKECVNETLKQTEECRAQCVMVSRVIPEEPDTVQGLYERAAGEKGYLSLSLLSCKQMCVTLVSTRPGRVSAVEDFLPLQLEHLHIAQFKAGDLKGAVETLRSLLLFYPTDSDSLSNLELYTQTVEVNTEAQETGPMQEIAKYISRALQEKRLLYFGMANLDFKFSDPDLWTPEDILATVAASVGDGHRGRRSPHTPHEKFEGLTVLRALKLAQDGLVNQSDARLLHEIGETVKVLMDSYFRSHSVLYFAYTHLVCRSAIPGHQEGRSDLSHPVHVDNCILEPETRQCWREAPAFTHRDLSAVLYLNDDFEGGDFFFADRDAKTVTAMVKPKCGRLVGFTSGPVNPHGVTAVTAGRRCALALWFTTEKQHRDMEREEAEELWAADGKSVVKEEKGEGESALKSARSGRSQGKERSKDRERVTGRRDEL
uniref:procollagen-proline 3-dioxygenase n=1 Tax=Cyprinus carpio TaxID=7962 RepID=A0A8C2J6B6_CYPCA